MIKQEFEYYYGIESEQYSFYRVPKLLIKDERFKKLTSDAKLLYGLMLDRMSMSIKNGWLDEEGRAYIYYTVENIMEDMGCARATCIKIMAELDSKKGIGLIEKKRQGQGRPDIIYVKNFVVQEESVVPQNKKRSDENTDISSEVQKLNFKKFRNQTSGSSEVEPQEVQNLNPNYTKYNNTEYSYPINLSDKSEDEKEDPITIDKIDADARDTYRDIVRENIDYDVQMNELDMHDRERFREMYELICDVICVKGESVRINNADIPWDIVCSRFLKLKSTHLLYVIKCLNQTATKIGNIRAYLLTALYNAPITMSNWIDQRVQYDMFGGGWQEMGIT